jgi:hypothetical protein
MPLPVFGGDFTLIPSTGTFGDLGGDCLEGDLKFLVLPPPIDGLLLESGLLSFVVADL